MTEPTPEEPPTEPEPLPPIPRDTKPDDVITALGFVPSDTRAVVITSAAVVGVAETVPDVENPPDPFAAAEPEKPAPSPTREATRANT